MDISCNCTDCNSGIQGNTTTVLEGRTACLRNIYVMILTGLGGVILTTLCFSIYFLIIGKYEPSLFVAQSSTTTSPKFLILSHV